MPNFRLISSKTCPYVQRSVMTLREKGIAYDIEYVAPGQILPLIGGRLAFQLVGD
jgi:glutathione S-transferase